MHIYRKYILPQSEVYTSVTCLYHDALFPGGGGAITNILIMVEIHEEQDVVSEVSQGTPRPARVALANSL